MRRTSEHLREDKAHLHLFDEGQKGSGRLGWRPPEDSGSVQLLAVLSAAETSQAALLIQPGLLALRLEVATVPELSEDPGPLHRGLEPFQETFSVLTIAECYKRQINSPSVVFSRNDLFGPMSITRPDAAPQRHANAGSRPLVAFRGFTGDIDLPEHDIHGTPQIGVDQLVGPENDPPAGRRVYPCSDFHHVSGQQVKVTCVDVVDASGGFEPDACCIRQCATPHSSLWQGQPEHEPLQRQPWVDVAPQIAQRLFDGVNRIGNLSR